jgi:hypothetical protein
LKKIEKEWHETLIRARQNTVGAEKKTELPRTSIALLNDVLTHVQTSGLVVVSANFLPVGGEKNNEIVMIKLIAQGDFPQLFSFMMALNDFVFPLVVLDFSYQAKVPGVFLFTAKIALFKYKNPHFLNEKNKAIPRNPFCFSLPFSPEVQTKEEVKAQKFSLHELKMTGYVRQENQHQALFLLPNLSLISLSVGDRIGKEKGKMIEINPYYVRFLLPNQKIILLKR